MTQKFIYTPNRDHPSGYVDRKFVKKHLQRYYRAAEAAFRWSRLMRGEVIQLQLGTVKLED